MPGTRFRPERLEASARTEHLAGISARTADRSAVAWAVRPGCPARMDARRSSAMDGAHGICMETGEVLGRVDSTRL